MNELRRISLCLSVLLLVACAGSSETIPEPEPFDGPVAEKDVHNPCGRPLAREGGFDLDVRERLGYVRGFEKQWKIPAWVSYRLEHRWYKPGASKFDWPGRYLSDPDLDLEFRITHNHYTDTGFDRGQMASLPAMQGRTKDVVRESVYMSNVAPIYPALERRLWMNLEGQVRKWARTYGRIYAVTGPIFKGEPTWMTPVKPGVDGQVAIPTHFFKIIYRKTGDDLFALAFVVPNQKERFDSDRDFRPWQVTIRDVEDWTGFDFLSRLDNEIELRLETTKEEMWK